MFKCSFDFYYGKEAEQFTFYRIPKLLFTDSRFLKLSIEAKVLYGLLLDRMSLSVKNGWFDEENRVYIYFKVSEAMKYMNVCKDKCIKLFAELDSEKGCGLIVRKRQGLGKPSVIYVMNFNSEACEDKKEIDNGAAGHFQRSENQTSGSSHTEPEEVDNIDSNKNNINNHTDSSDIHSILSYHKREEPKERDVMNEIREWEKYKELIAEKIEYEYIAKNYSPSSAEEILEIMLDAVCSRKDYLVVSGTELPQTVVKNRLLKLDYNHIGYVLDCIKKNTTKIYNIKSYMLTALYNSFDTMAHYYTAQANHDLYGSG